MTEPITAVDTRVLRALSECDGPVAIETIMMMTSLPRLAVTAAIDNLVTVGYVAPLFNLTQPDPPGAPDDRCRSVHPSTCLWSDDYVPL